MKKNPAYQLSPKERHKFFRQLLTVSPYDESDYGEEVCVDILTDMMHFVNIEKLDFDAIYKTAEHHFEAEKDTPQNTQ